MNSEGLNVRGISKSFADETVLKGIDLSIEPGEFCVVLGPSGCGKTTLLRCIAGIETLDEGDVIHEGMNLDGVLPQDRDIAIVFQDFEDRLFPHMTVEANVAFGLRRQEREYTDEEIARRVEEALEFVAIGELKDDMPKNLSGGQQQRVELARQFARSVDTMLLDDPLGDLDYKLQKRLELDLRRIHAESQRTFLYVTHDQDEALKLADKLVVMNDGQIEQAGPVEEVYETPETAFVGRFVGDSNMLTGSVSTFDGDRVEMDTDIGTVSATVRTETARGTGAPEEGELGVLLIRPEHVELDVTPGSHDNTVEATFRGRTYTGTETEFSFGIEGLDVGLQARKSGDVTVSTETEWYRLGWDAGDVNYFGPDRLSVQDTTIADLREL
jgi:ABC-type Fe3+/spermidine/putrescine transport system ATPase subunit